jgi:hypothetical protein
MRTDNPTLSNPGWRIVRSSRMAFTRGYMLSPFQGHVEMSLEPEFLIFKSLQTTNNVPLPKKTGQAVANEGEQVMRLQLQ